jgi:MFS family permease
MSRVLWLIPALYFVFVAAEFGALTHLALTATQRGESAFRVGWLAAAMWVGILCSSACAHRISMRLGFVASLVLGCGLALGSLLSFNATEVFGLWALGACVLGLGGGVVWVVGESWLAEAAPPEKRGLYVGWFEAAVGLGLMVGPLMIPLARFMDWNPLVLAAAVMALAVVSSFLLIGHRSPGPRPHATHAAPIQNPVLPWKTVARPLLMMAILSGMMEAGVSALMPSLSMRTGFSIEAAALLGTVIGAGSALLQPPAGHMADRWGVQRMILACWVLLLVTSLGFLLRADHPGALLWLVGFLLGGVGGAIYTLSIIDMGNRLNGAALVKAIAALVICYSIGTASAPVLGGILFDLWGMPGFATAFVVLCVVGTCLSWRQQAISRRAAR